MSDFLRTPYIKVLCCYLVLFMAGLIPVPETAWASFIYHQPGKTNELDHESLEILQILLENELITEKLSELGLTEKEIIQRIEQLSPEEREIVLDELKDVQKGGRWSVVFILLLIIWIFVDFVRGMERLKSSPFTTKTPRDASFKNQDLSFLKRTESDFPRYEGEVRVLVRKVPEEDSIWVGSIYVQTKSKRVSLFEKMKKEAAKHGADTITLYTDEPTWTESGWRDWSAEAYRTQNIEDNQ